MRVAAELDATVGVEARGGAPGRQAEGVDADRQAARVRVGDLDVGRDDQRRPREAHGADADVVAERGQLGLELRDHGIGMTTADRAQARRLLAEPHARVLGAAEAHAHDGRLAGEPALAELHEGVDEEALDAARAVGGEQHPVVAAEEAALVHGGDVDPVGAGLERVRDLGRVGADVVVVIRAGERVHAVRAQRDGGRGVGGGPAQRPLEGDEATVDDRLVARADVVARQPRVGAHRPTLGGGDVPVLEHLVEDEAGEALLLAVAGQADAFAVVGRDVDGRAGHQLAGRVLDQLGGDLRHVVEELSPLTLPSPLRGEGKARASACLSARPCGACTRWSRRGPARRPR